MSPGYYEEKAERVANDIIRDKQIEAVGQTEPFTIERPTDELRRKLIVGQYLPIAGPSSLGSQFLPRAPKLPESVAAGVPLPPPAPQPLPPLKLSLVEALEVGAQNNREYQQRKEQVFIAALDLDFERNRFDTQFFGLIDADASANLAGEDQAGVVLSPSIGFDKLLKSGALITTRIGVDLAKLLTGNRGQSLGLFADASATIPLLRGAGREVVTEPLQQAERDAVYAIWEFETFKKEFALQIAAAYLNVLQSIDAVENAEANYRRLVASTRRARRLADAGRLPGFQVDQSVTQELGARSRLISARENVGRRLDQFKLLLGLPPDAGLELDREELAQLQPIADRVLAATAVVPPPPPPPPPDALLEPPPEAPIPATTPAPQPPSNALPDEQIPTTQGLQPGEVPPEPVAPAEVLVELNYGRGGPLELPPAQAVLIALENRLDLRVALAQAYDAQRKVVVAADRLEAIFDVNLSAGLGERRGVFSGAADDSTSLSLSEGSYSAGAVLDLPFERTAERNDYRISLIAYERAVRAAQQFEDQVKLDVANTIRDLIEANEGLQIEAQQVQVARRRVASTTLFLEAGRAEIRDLLEAEDALVTAQNAFTQALVEYRIAELELQRDMGVLQVDERGLWAEYTPPPAQPVPVPPLPEAPLQPEAPGANGKVSPAANPPVGPPVYPPAGEPVQLGVISPSSYEQPTKGRPQ